MAKVSRRLSKRGSDRRPRPSLLENLTSDEASEVLQRLIEEQASLRTDAERIARTILTELDYKTVAEQVKDCILGVEVEEIYARSGSQQLGYVQPNEAAWEVFEEEMKPFLDNIERLISLGMTEEAIETSKGIIVGLYSFKSSDETEALEQIPDFPGETAAYALEVFRRAAAGIRSRGGGKARTLRFPGDFLRDHAPEWHEFLSRVLSQRRR